MRLLSLPNDKISHSSLLNEDEGDNMKMKMIEMIPTLTHESDGVLK